MRGGYGSGEYGSLEERINGTLTGERRRPASPARHCFVDDQPSLLIEWRRGPKGWEGRVISVQYLKGQGWATVDRWLPAAAVSRGMPPNL
jgi:hypothetical protein